MVTRLFHRLLILIVALSCVLASESVFASVQAFVDRNPVAMDQTFTLTLKSSEDGQPDLKPLMQDFDIISQGKSSSFQFINGQSSHSTSWEITLAPKHAGQLQIPPLSVNGNASAPIALTVMPAGSNQGKAAQQGSNLYLEVSAEPQTAYVQQQIVLSVRLYRTVDLGDGSTLSEPKFPAANAVVEKLGDDRSYQTIRNGQNYAVIERRYAVYPQRSGQFSMEPIQFDGNIIDNNQNNSFFFDPFNQHTSHVRVHSDVLHISVLPAPAQFSGKQWLPANKLALTESWSPNPPTFTVGEPVTRTLILSAQGLTAAQLPSIGNDAIDGFKLYPDQPALKDHTSDTGIDSTRVEKIAMIPTRPGTLTLPAVEIKWWNTRTNQQETAQIPARTITVTAAANNQPVVPAAQQSVPAEAAQSPAPVQPAQSVVIRAGWWPWLSLALGLGWLITCVAWWLSRRSMPASSNPIHDTSKRAQDETLRKVESKLKKACAENDASQAAMQLLAWGKLKWPASPPANLLALARLCEPALSAALVELDRCQYAKENAGWHGAELWRVFTAQRPAVAVDKKENQDALKPLYGGSDI